MDSLEHADGHALTDGEHVFHSNSQRGYLRVLKKSFLGITKTWSKYWAVLENGILSLHKTPWSFKAAVRYTVNASSIADFVGTDATVDPCRAPNLFVFELKTRRYQSATEFSRPKIVYFCAMEREESMQWVEALQAHINFWRYTVGHASNELQVPGVTCMMNRSNSVDDDVWSEGSYNSAGAYVEPTTMGARRLSYALSNLTLRSSASHEDLRRMPSTGSLIRKYGHRLRAHTAADGRNPLYVLAELHGSSSSVDPPNPAEDRSPQEEERDANNASSSSSAQPDEVGNERRSSFIISVDHEPYSPSAETEPDTDEEEPHRSGDGTLNPPAIVFESGDDCESTASFGTPSSEYTLSRKSVPLSLLGEDKDHRPAFIPTGVDLGHSSGALSVELDNAGVGTGTGVVAPHGGGVPMSSPLQK